GDAPRGQPLVSSSERLTNHVVGEESEFYFTRFWGKGKVADMAQPVKAALDAQKKASTDAFARWMLTNHTKRKHSYGTRTSTSPERSALPNAEHAETTE